MVGPLEKILGGLLLAIPAVLFLRMFLHGLQYSLGLKGLLQSGWTTTHWEAVFRSGVLLESMALSAVTALIVTMLSLVGAVVLIGTRFCYGTGKCLEASLLLALSTPAIVMAMLTRLWLEPGGLIARMLFWTGGISSPAEFPVLINDPYSLGLILCGVFCSLPFLALFFLRVWEANALHRYVSTAVLLGASPWQAVWRIALPMLWNRSRTLLVLIFLWNFSAWEGPLLVGQQSPRMISVLIADSTGEFSLADRPRSFTYSTTYFVLAAAGLAVLTRRGRHHVCRD